MFNFSRSFSRRYLVKIIDQSIIVATRQCLHACIATLYKTDDMYESISLLPPQAGWTALHFAVHMTEHKVIETLLTFAINLTIRNRVGHISESKMLVNIKMSVLRYIIGIYLHMCVLFCITERMDS